MSQATETLGKVRTLVGVAEVRERAVLEEQIVLILTKIPDAGADWEDTYRGQLTGLLFALGMDWHQAKLAALSLWDNEYILAELLDSLEGRAVVQQLGPGPGRDS